MLPKRSGQKAEDKKVEHKPSKIRKLNVRERDDEIYRTPKFRNGRLPTQYQMFKGPIADLKIKVLVPVLDNKGQAVLNEDGQPVEVVKEETIKYYDCMDAYQKALPGQGFARIKFQHPTEDILVDALVPAFNKDDGKEEERKHLQRLGIPYVESDQPRGKNTGIIHNHAAKIFGFDLKDAQDGIVIGGAVVKGKELLFNSLSKNALCIAWDEEYLLAYGLWEYDPETMHDSEMYIRRKEPEYMALASKSPLQEEIREKYKEIIESKDPSYDPKNLDNGNWINNFIYDTTIDNPFAILASHHAFTTNSHMDKWKKLSRIEKNALLVTTMNKAIKENDPSSYTAMISSKKVSYISRILKLNQTNALKIRDQDFQAIFEAALEKKLFVADEFLEYSNTIDLSPAITRYFTKALLEKSSDVEDILDKFKKYIPTILLKDFNETQWTSSLLDNILKNSPPTLFQKIINLDDKLMGRNKHGISLLEKTIEYDRMDLFEIILEKSRKSSPEIFQELNIAALNSFVKGNDQTLDILIKNGATILSEDDAKKFGVKKYFDVATNKMQESITQYVLSNDVDSLNKLELTFSPLIKHAIQQINNTKGNELLVTAAKECNLPLMKWLLQHGATANVINDQKEFSRSLKKGIAKKHAGKDSEALLEIFENYKRELMKDSVEISDRFIIEDLLKESKKINVSLLQDLERKHPDTIQSMISVQSDGVSLINVSLQNRDLSSFLWLIKHGAVIPESVFWSFNKNNENHPLKEWITDYIDKEDLASIKTMKEYFDKSDKSIFPKVIKELDLVSAAASKVNINILKFFKESGADDPMKSAGPLYNYVKKSSVTPKIVCDIWEYLDDSFPMHYNTIKSKVFSHVTSCIENNDYETLKRFKTLLINNSSEDGAGTYWKIFLDQKNSDGNVIKLMEKQPYFNDQIKEILGIKDSTPSALRSHSVFSSEKKDDDKPEGPTITPSRDKP